MRVVMTQPSLLIHPHRMSLTQHQHQLNRVIAVTHTNTHADGLNDVLHLTRYRTRITGCDSAIGTLMPLYTYKCTYCNRKFAVLRAIAKREAAPCSVCGKPAKKIMDVGGFSIHGPGTYKYETGQEEDK